SLACGYQSIVVASYDAHHDGIAPISVFSSAGPTRDGRNKPEISAPGQDVIAARSATDTGVIRMSGTSMAAPAVAGAIAVMLSQPNVKMDATQIKGAVRAAGPPVAASAGCGVGCALRPRPNQRAPDATTPETGAGGGRLVPPQGNEGDEENESDESDEENEGDEANEGNEN